MLATQPLVSFSYSTCRVNTKEIILDEDLVGNITDVCNMILKLVPEEHRSNTYVELDSIHTKDGEKPRLNVFWSRPATHDEIQTYNTYIVRKHEEESKKCRELFETIRKINPEILASLIQEYRRNI